MLLSNGKASSPDGIPAEILYVDVNTFVDVREIHEERNGEGGFKYRWSKMVAEEKAGWRQGVCGLCSTASEKSRYTT